MQDFLQNAKRVANQATERATWEANRMRRVNARLHEVDLARRERAALLEQLAGVVLDLEHRGQLVQDPLLALARRLRAVDQEIATGGADAQAIRNETFQPGAGAGPSGGPARPAAPAPVLTPPAQPARAPGQHACPNCGQPVSDGAAFCSACGARQR
jgi:hypothetical protein